VTVSSGDLGRPEAHRLVHEPAARGGDVASGAGRPLLDVCDLSVSFATRDGAVQAVEGVSFQLGVGEVLAIVGESGSGKSVCAMSLMGLTRGPNATVSGSAMFEGRDLIGASEAELRRVRGAQLAMVFQDPQSSLNPVYRVGDQIIEQIRAHEPFVSRAQGLARAVALMERVGIPLAAERVRAYPHELSGGMRQRVMIAMGLSLGAKVLFADEPTTALDVTVQAQILEQLKRLRDTEDLSIVLVTHDFGVVADIADRIAVMQAGRIVEQGAAGEILHEPKHPYTQGLLGALQPFKKADAPPARGGALSLDRQTGPPAPADGAQHAEVATSKMADAPRARGGALLLAIDNLRVSYAGRSRRTPSIDALDGVSLKLEAGETLAIVGESGSGKTTLLRSIARLIEPTEGAILLQGQDLAGASRRELALLRRELGVVFQDPQASLNPRRRVGATLERALRARGLGKAEAQCEVGPWLERVGLKQIYATRYPHELSGGERQRVGIARALAGEPRLVLLDEPVSSLDASIRRGVIELLGELQEQLGCAYVLVSHDFATVEALADRVAVMHVGKIVELGNAEEVLFEPKHPYTQELIATCPRMPVGVASSAWTTPRSSSRA
jgi:peptide/nickel transport system ATP-binding protein